MTPTEERAEIRRLSKIKRLRKRVFAVTENNTHEARALTAREIEALADRCLARGISALFDAYHLQADFLVLSALLRVLARQNRDGVECEIWKETL
jgi:predicted kinase